MAKRCGTFTITVTPNKRSRTLDEEDKEETVLILAPFQRQPKLIFNEVKFGTSKLSSFRVINPTKKNLEIAFDEVESEKCGTLKCCPAMLTLLAGESAVVSVTWSPDCPGNMHTSIPVKQIFPDKASRKISQVSVVGSCTAPKKINKSKFQNKRSNIQPLKEKNIFIVPNKFAENTNKESYTDSKTVGEIPEERNITVRKKGLRSVPTTEKSQSKSSPLKSVCSDTFLCSDKISPDNKDLSATYTKQKPQVSSNTRSCQRKQLFSESAQSPPTSVLLSNITSGHILVNEIFSKTGVTESPTKIDCTDQKSARESELGPANIRDASFERDSLEGSFNSQASISGSYSTFERQLENFEFNNPSVETGIQMPCRSSVYLPKKNIFSSCTNVQVNLSNLESHVNATYTVNETSNNEEFPAFFNQIRFRSPSFKINSVSNKQNERTCDVLSPSNTQYCNDDSRKCNFDGTYICVSPAVHPGNKKPLTSLSEDCSNYVFSSVESGNKADCTFIHHQLGVSLASKQTKVIQAAQSPSPLKTGVRFKADCTFIHPQLGVSLASKQTEVNQAAQSPSPLKTDVSFIGDTYKIASDSTFLCTEFSKKPELTLLDVSQTDDDPVPFDISGNIKFQFKPTSVLNCSQSFISPIKSKEQLETGSESSEASFHTPDCVFPISEDVPRSHLKDEDNNSSLASLRISLLKRIRYPSDDTALEMEHGDESVLSSEEKKTSGLWTISPPKKLKTKVDSDSPIVLPPVRTKSRQSSTNLRQSNKSPVKLTAISNTRPVSADYLSSRNKDAVSDPRLIASAKKSKPSQVKFKIPQARLNLRRSLRNTNNKKIENLESTELHKSLLKSNCFTSFKSNHLFNETKVVDLSKNPFTKELLLYVDTAFIDGAEKELLRWANIMLSPPLELEAVTMMPTTKQITNYSKACFKYSNPGNVEYRLKSVRKASIMLLLSDDVSSVLSKLHVAIDKGLLAIRNDRDLHRDVGLQEIVLKLLLCYHPLWLRVGLESIYGQTICLNSNSDAAGIVNFIRKHLLTDDYIKKKYSHPTVPFLMMAGFEVEMKKFILKKFLMVVYFLDVAKQNKLIRHDPCLFCLNSPYKESGAIVLEFNREFLKGGVNLKYLSSFGYKVLHKQTFLEEFDLKIKDRNDLRDGIRLTKVMEMIINCEKGLLYSQLRAPAVSRYQKIHNNKVALNAYRNAGYVIENNVTEEDIVNGHREKLLSLLWQLRGKVFHDAAITIQIFWKQNKEAIKQRFRFLKMQNAACKIQKWYRKMINNRNPEREAFLEKKKAAVYIQRCFRRKIFFRQMRIDLQKREAAAVVIQNYYRLYLKQKKLRQDFIALKTSTIKIQRRYRALVEMRKQRIAYENIKRAVKVLTSWCRRAVEVKRARNRYIEMKKAAVVIQKAFRRYNETKNDKMKFKETKHSVIVIQNWYRQVLRDKKAIKAAVVIQNRWRAVLIMRKKRYEYINLKRTVLFIEQKRKCTLISRKVRSDFVNMQESAKILQRHWKALLYMRKERRQYLNLKKAVLFVEEKRTAMLIGRKERSYYISVKMATAFVQSQWRAVVCMRKERAHYLNLKRAVEFVELIRAATLVARRERAHYLSLKTASVVFQSRWRGVLRMRKEREQYLNLKKAVAFIETKRVNTLLVRKEQANFAIFKNAAITLQKWWRALLFMRRERNYYLNLKKAVHYVELRRSSSLIARKERSYYIELRKAAVILQSQWRAMLCMRKERSLYLNIKKITLFIEEKRVATLIARRERANFVALEKSVVILQRRWRALLCMRKARDYYSSLKKAALFVEKQRVAVLNVRKQRYNIALKNAATTIQLWWRAELCMRKERNFFLNLKRTVLYVENKRAATLTARKESSEYIALKRAAIVLQRQWRAMHCMRKERNFYVNLKKIVLFIEQKRLAKMMCEKDHYSFISLKSAAITLQRWWRNIQAKEEEKRNAQLNIEHIRDMAATKIQAFWRGYKVEKICLKRSHSSVRSLFPGVPLKDLVQQVINGLRSEKINVNLRHLMLLDVMTSSSYKLACDLVQLDIVNLLYNSLENLNQNIGDQEIRLLIFIVFLNLNKYTSTSKDLWKVTVARRGCDMMLLNCLRFCKTNPSIFCTDVMLLWSWSFDADKLETIVSEKSFDYVIHKVTSVLTKGPKVKTIKRVEKNELLFPQRKQIWGLKDATPEMLNDPIFAWDALLKRLKHL